MKETNIQVRLKDILGDSYYQYIKQVVIPLALERVNQKKIILEDENTLTMQVLKEKNDPFDAVTTIMTDNSRTTFTNGYLARALHSPVNGLDLELMIKKSNDRQSFENGSTALGSLIKTLKDTEFENYLPRFQFTNPSKNITVTPLLKGQILASYLQDKTRPEQINIVKNVLTQHAKFLKFINQPEIRSNIAFPNPNVDFNEYFFRRYSDKFPFYDIYKKEIGDTLNDEYAGHLITGDFHKENIILNGTIKEFDFDNSIYNGFYEYEAVKLIRKLGFTIAEENDIARHFASELFQEAQEREESFKRFVKLKINSDIHMPLHYLQGLDLSQPHTSKNNQKNIAHAKIYHTDLIARLEDSASKGIITSEFYRLFSRDIDLEGIKISRLSPDEYSELSSIADPNSSLTRPAIMQPKMIISEPGEGFRKIEKDYNKRAFRKKLLLPILTTALIASIGITNYITNSITDIAQQLKEGKAQKARLIEIKDDYQKVSFEYIFRKPYAIIKENILAGASNEGYFIGAGFIDSVCTTKGISSNLINNILKINRIMMGETLQLYEKNTHINVFDIMLMYEQIQKEEYYSPRSMADSVTNMKKNLSDGIDRLKYLISKHDQDTVRTLYEFWTPRYGKFGVFGNKDWREGNDFQKTIKTALKNMVYSATTGNFMGDYSGGTYYTNIATAPKDFPEHFDISPELLAKPQTNLPDPFHGL